MMLFLNFKFYLYLKKFFGILKNIILDTKYANEVQEIISNFPKNFIIHIKDIEKKEYKSFKNKNFYLNIL